MAEKDRQDPAEDTIFQCSILIKTYVESGCSYHGLSARLLFLGFYPQRISPGIKQKEIYLVLY